MERPKRAADTGRASTSGAGQAAPFTGFDADAVVTELESKLRAASTPARAERERAYLKSRLVHLGASLPDTRRIARLVFRDRVPTVREATLAVATALWARGLHELRMATSDLLGQRAALLTATDLQFLERLLRESGTWALIDDIAPSALWSLVAAHPEVEDSVRRWVTDPDFWMRRSAVLVYLYPMRRGEPVFARFAAAADPLLENREFFVRKAIGWVLRERSKSLPDEVFAWLEPRRARASRLTLREGSKYLAADQRAVLLGG